MITTPPGKSMTITARYSGICPECDERWQPGDLIQAGPNTGWQHAVCPDPTPTLRAGEIRCRTCYLIHPKGECDR